MKKYVFLFGFLFVMFTFLFSTDDVVFDVFDTGGKISSYDVSLAFINEGSELDALVANPWGPVQYWHGNGDGTFTLRQNFAGSPPAIGIAIGKQGDDHYAFICMAAHQNELWKYNQDLDEFELFQKMDGSYNSRNAILEDFDKDGDMDIFVSNDDGDPELFYLRDGETGGFVLQPTLGVLDSWGIAAEDLNNDNYLDVIVSNQRNQKNIVWLNDQNGYFCQYWTFPESYSLGVAIGDLNNDNIPDAVFANYMNGSEVWFGKGDGSFEKNQTFSDTFGRDVALDDFNLDGFKDIIIVGGNGTPNEIWINDKTGFFIISSTIYGEGENSSGVITGNLNNDILPDIFVTNHNGQSNKVYINNTKITIQATIDINPNTLNLKSKGKWITTYIELPDGHYVNDINISTVAISEIDDIELSETILAEAHPSTISDYDGDGIADLMVKFSRKSLISLLEAGQRKITISGNLYDGTDIKGSDTIKVIH